MLKKGVTKGVNDTEESKIQAFYTNITVKVKSYSKVI